MNMLKTGFWLSCLLLFALGISACDRRDNQPVEASNTTDTIIHPTAIDAGATDDPLQPPATSPCNGLTGDALTECRERERAGGTRKPGEPKGDTGNRTDVQ